MRITSNIKHIAMNYEVQTYNGLSHKKQLAKTETNDNPLIEKGGAVRGEYHFDKDNSYNIIVNGMN